MMSLPTRFTAVYKPRVQQPDKPILVGRSLSQARISIVDAELLVNELQAAIKASITQSNLLEDW